MFTCTMVYINYTDNLFQPSLPLIMHTSSYLLTLYGCMPPSDSSMYMMLLHHPL